MDQLHHEEETHEPPEWLRPVEIVLGLLSILVAMVVVLNPSYGIRTVVSLLSVSMLFYAVRMVISAGIATLPRIVRGGGVVGGLAVGAIVLVEVFFPRVGFTSLVTLFASALAIQGIVRLTQSLNRSHPTWFRVSASTVGGTTLMFALIAIALPNIASVILVALLTGIIMINGAESIISGIRPSNPKQMMLIKLIGFSIFYGFVNVNWIDLFGKQVPAYHIWLILTYLAPFGVLLVFQGVKDWQLAASLGLLVSLVNDLGYFFAGDLFFGFHVDLVPWLIGQLGFYGNHVLFIFQGGPFTIPVTSCLMGFTIYARIALVSFVLFHWWKSPSQQKEFTVRQ